MPPNQQELEDFKRIWKRWSENSKIGTIYICLLLEFDDDFNDFQWRLINEMLKGALPMKRPFRGEINKDDVNLSSDFKG